MKCPKCHSHNPDTKQFCSDCGTQLIPYEEAQPSLTKTLETPKGDLTRGSLLADRYEIIEVLGKGGMGDVYRVVDKKINEEVALKLLKPEIAADKKTLERFGNELKLARKIVHKNVGRMYHLGEDKGTHFITMEYVPGQDLKGLIRQSGQLAVGTTINIARQICDGLTEAHRLGVVHRDLKPSNIMIDREGHARIMDFGIARSLTAKGITGAGVIIGTPEYMSPEQVEGKEVDQRADIYSLGVILYEMVTGQVPFEGDTPLSIAYKHKHEVPQDPRKVNPQITEDLSRLVLKCLEKDEENRYQSADELSAELTSIGKGTPTTERLAQERRPLTSREITVQLSLKKLVIPLIVFVVAVMIGLILWLPWTRKTPSPIFADKPSLAIIYFENVTGNESLDGWKIAISDLMITDLNQSKFIRVIPGDRVYSIMENLDLLEITKYSTEDLKEIADEAGVSHICYGSFVEAGDNIIINFIIKNPHTDKIIRSLRKECEGEKDISSKIDELTKEIKVALNLSQEQISSDLDKALGQITTSSSQAWKFYSEGRIFKYRGNDSEAAKSFKKAVEIDPEFAMAFRALSVVADEPAERRKYLQIAFDLRERLSDVERLLIEGDFYAGKEEFQNAIDAYERLVDLYPEHLGRLNLISLYNRDLAQWDKALEQVEIGKNFHSKSIYFVRVAAWTFRGLNQYDKAEEILKNYLDEVGDHVWAHDWLALVYYEQGKDELAHIETDKGIELAPPGWFREYFRKGDIYLCQEKIAQAAEHYGKLLDFDETLPVRWGRDRLGKVYLFQGKFLDAQMEFRKGAEFLKKADEKIREAEFHLGLARLFHKTGNNTGALGEHDRAWSLAVETENLELKRKVLYLRGLIQLEQGLIDETQKTADEMRFVVETDMNNTAKSTFHHLMGRKELHKQNYTAAIEHLKKALSFLSYGPRTWDADIIDSLATAYYRSGDTENAIKEYEKITMLSTGKVDYGDTYAKAFYMLGKIFEQQGDTATAIEHYENFLELWKDADPGIAEAADARKRLSELINP